MTNTNQKPLRGIIFECAKQGLLIDAPIILIFTVNPTLAGLYIGGHTLSCTIRSVGGSYIDSLYPPDENGTRSTTNLALQFTVGAIGGLVKYSVTGGIPSIGSVNNGLYQLTGKMLSTSGSIAATTLIEVGDEVLKALSGQPYNIELGIKIGAALTIASALYVSEVYDKAYDTGKESLTDFIAGKTLAEEGEL